MTDQLTVLEPGPIVQVRENQQPMIYSMIHLAIEKGASIDQLERLWDMQLKYEANEAKKAYHFAMSEFKKERIVSQKIRTMLNTNRNMHQLEILLIPSLRFLGNMG